MGGDDFLSALDEPARGALEAAGRRRCFPRGAALFHAREATDHVVVLMSGRVKVTRVSEGGHETVLAFRGPGDLLGEQSGIDAEPRSATVTAVEDVEALVVSATHWRAFTERTPPAAARLVEILNRRLREADRLRLEYGSLDTVGRVAARLIELVERFGEPTDDGFRIDLPLSQEELAGWVGSSREAVAKALHTLRSAGWLRTERRSITVLDLEALERRSA
jgi:CRP/FNR family cyclic AMP-dependent transcriptional regulator